MFEEKHIEITTPITGDPNVDKQSERMANKLISEINKSSHEDKKPKAEIVKEQTVATVQHKEVDMFTAVKDAIAPAVEIALFGAALVLIGKYIFIVFGVDDPHCRASIIDVWFGIGIVVGLLINDAINLKIHKGD